jgi:hypothetical protein
LGVEVLDLGYFIILLRDLGMGIVPRLFPEGGGIGFGMSDGHYEMIISNIRIVRTLGKSHIVKPWLLTLEVFKGPYNPRQKGSRLMGKACNLFIVL